MNRLRPVRLLLMVVVALLLAACGTVRNTSVDGDDRNLMLRGNDPVSYFDLGGPVPGTPTFTTEYNGGSYRFATAANRATFVANPGRYEPQYAGFCASGAPYALKAAIGASTFAIVDDKLYLFGSDRSRRNWLLDYPDNIRTGDEYWITETRDVPYRLQNAKRYVWKVPGYKTDAELDALFAQRQAAGTLNPLARQYAR